MTNLKAGAKRALRPTYYGFLRLMPLTFRRGFLYFLGTRRFLRLTSPRRFTEKVNWRIINDRREVLFPTCDKEAMKSMAFARAGHLVRIPRTLWFGTDVEELEISPLPKRWVMKPNHRAGQVFFGGPETELADLQHASRGWLNNLNADVFGEWAYGKARQAIIVEEFLGTPGTIPSDYKVYVFDGQAELIQLHDCRYGAHSSRYYDRTWAPIAARNISYEVSPPAARPEQLDQLLAAAEEIGADFDFMRVDFYIVDGKVWFGEVSPYPAGGISRFDPPSFDFELGSKWSLPKVR